MGQVIAFNINPPSLFPDEELERMRQQGVDIVKPWLAQNGDDPRLKRAMRSLTKQTRATYRSVLSRLDKWLDGRPLTDTLLADWCDKLHEQGKAPASAEMVVNAARFRAAALQTDNPVGAETKRALKMVIREGAGRGRGRARSLTLEEVKKIIQETERQDTIWAVRDAALIAVTFHCGLRISETVNLNIEDFQLTDDKEFAGEGIIQIRQSKTDQRGTGTPVPVPFDAASRVCAWIATAGISHGPLFRPFANAPEGGHKIADRKLGKAMAAIIVKRRAAAVGFKGITSHSMRRSFAQHLDSLGFSTHAIMQAGRWKSSAMVDTYTANQQALRSKVLGAFRRVSTTKRQEQK